MTDRNQTTASAEQQKLGELIRQRTAEREQEVYNHGFDNVPKAYMAQLCSAGRTAQARRNRKPERQQEEEKMVADLRRDKRELMEEIGLRELVAQYKELSIQKLEIRIGRMDLEQRTMEQEHQAELAGRDYAEAVLLSDLRELCQVKDEEVEELRRIIDRQALPPAYDQIADQVHVERSVMDVATANATTVLSSAKASLRRVIAESHNHSNRLFPVAKAFLNAISSVTRASNKGTWPVNCTFQILEAVYEMCSRVCQYMTLSLSLDDHDGEVLSQSRPRRLLPSYLDATKRTHRTLRKAFISADNLTSETISHHFSSGGRRAGLFTSAVPFICPLHDGIVDLEDEFQELHYWKGRFEGVKREMLGWRDDVGIVVFVDSLAWLEQNVMAAVV